MQNLKSLEECTLSRAPQMQFNLSSPFHSSVRVVRNLRNNVDYMEVNGSVNENSIENLKRNYSIDFSDLCERFKLSEVREHCESKKVPKETYKYMERKVGGGYSATEQLAVEIGQKQANMLCGSSIKSINNQPNIEDLEQRFHSDSGLSGASLTALDYLSTLTIPQLRYELNPDRDIPLGFSDMPPGVDTVYFKYSKNSGNTLPVGAFRVSPGGGVRKGTDVQSEYGNASTMWLANQTQYNMIEVAQSSVAKFDLIQEKIQANLQVLASVKEQAAFLGDNTSSKPFEGLLTLSNVNENTVVVPTYLSLMNTSQIISVMRTMLSTFMEQVKEIGALAPTTLLIPAADYYGLGVYFTDQFPVQTVWAAVNQAFSQLPNPISIRPNYYCQKERNGLGKNIYVLYCQNKDVVCRNEPIPLQSSAFATSDNFSFQNTCWSQITEVKALRPEAILYFTNTVDAPA